MTYTRNEVIAEKHDNQVYSMRKLADHIEKWQMDWEDVVRLLRDLADSHEAQAMVVRLRDEL